MENAEKGGDAVLFPSQCYSLLLVSCSERFNETVLSLCKPYCDPIRVVPSVNAAKRAALDQSYDLVLLNAPLPDGQGMDLAAELCAGRQTVCLLLLRAQAFKLLQSRAEEQGVFTLEKPTTPQTLETALHWMFAARQRLHRLEQKTQSLEEKMQEIRIVNRAKWLLIGQLGMTEADAHRYLEKQAMDRCVSRRAVAEEIIRVYDA